MIQPLTEASRGRSAGFLAHVLLLLWLVLPGAAMPVPPPASSIPEPPLTGANAERAPALKDWQKTLEDLEKQLTEPDLPDAGLVEFRDRLVALRAKVNAAMASAAADMEVVRSDQAALGPPPKEGEPPELAEIVARRKALNARQATADGTSKAGGLLLSQIDRLAERVEEDRRTRFTEHIFTRHLSPLAPAVWQQAWSELLSAYRTAAAAVAGSMESEIAAGAAWTPGRHAALGLASALLLAFPLRSWLIRRYGYVAVEGEPSYPQRLWAALFTGAVSTILPSMAAGAIYLGLVFDGSMPEAVNDVARLILLGLAGVFFVAGFCRSALAPNAPDWRLVPIHNEAARVVSSGVTLLAALFALDWVVSGILRVSAGSVELIAIHKFVLGLLISAVLLSLLRRRVWFRSADARLSVGWRLLRRLLAALVWGIPFTAILGYVALSRLLASQLVLTAALWALVALLRQVLAEFLARAFTREGLFGGYLRSSLGMTDDGAEILRFWLNGILQIVLVGMAVLTLPWLWGFTSKDFSAWFQGAFFGVTVGNLRISFASMVLAGFLFAVFLGLTRMFQRTLDDRIFPRTRMDQGLRHSIHSGIGYLGFVIASLVAVSTLGIDLSSLALIAGALSVGIGFGLQNVVNNFVSGLILLVERPIKVGDLVVVGDFHGHVRKISVRATEIITSDRASVFMPNSALISGNVMNRTHADASGRVVVPVGIAYGQDPLQAKEALLRIANAHPDVSRIQPAYVRFKGFGESALNLELVANLMDVEKAGTVTSDLCFAIYETFQRESIDMPFPQRDVRVRFDPEQWAHWQGGAEVEPPPSG